MKGNLLFQVDPKCLVGEVCKSKYCHCALCYDDNNIVEATFAGVTISPISKYENYDIFAVKNLDPLTADKIIISALKEINRFYDFPAVFYLGLQIIFHLKETKNPFDLSWLWFCSELLAQKFKDYGFDFVPGQDSGEVSPEEISESALVYKLYEIRKK